MTQFTRKSAPNQAELAQMKAPLSGTPGTARRPREIDNMSRQPVWTGSRDAGDWARDGRYFYPCPVSQTERLLDARSLYDVSPLGFALIYTPFQFVGLTGQPQPWEIVDRASSALRALVKGMVADAGVKPLPPELTLCLDWGGIHRAYLGGGTEALSVNWGRFTVHDLDPSSSRLNPNDYALWDGSEVAISPTLYSPHGWMRDGEFVDATAASQELLAASNKAGRLLAPSSCGFTIPKADGEPTKLGNDAYFEYSLEGLYPQGVCLETNREVVFLGRQWRYKSDGATIASHSTALRGDIARAQKTAQVLMSLDDIL
jgi:hypothetical protein